MHVHVLSHLNLTERLSYELQYFIEALSSVEDKIEIEQLFFGPNTRPYVLRAIQYNYYNIYNTFPKT